MRWHPSLFVKLAALTFAAAFLTILILSWFSHQRSNEVRDRHVRHLGPLAKVVVEVILRDSSPQTLERLSDELDIDIRYQDATYRFVTDDDIPPFSQLQTLKRHRLRGPFRRLPKEFSLAYDEHHQWYLLYKNQHQQLAIALEQEDDDNSAGVILILTLVLFAIWGIFYFSVRRQLSPLSRLKENMDAVGHGHWYPYQCTGTDEIAQLGQGFNQMQERLKDLIGRQERFLVDASHELRSPLARLRVAAEFITDESIRQKVIDDIKELETLTSQILSNAKLQSDHANVQMQPLNVVEWLDTLIRLRDDSEQPRIKPNYAIDDSPLFIRGDTRILSGAINNILDNALKYADYVYLQLQRCQENGKHSVLLSITDDGPGVKESELPHLFEPFFRADQSRTRETGGFGLGLAIAKAAVDRHQADIRVENGQSGGLCFELRFEECESTFEQRPL